MSPYEKEELLKSIQDKIDQLSLMVFEFNTKIKIEMRDIVDELEKVKNSQ
jgi:hypothetical protein